MIVVVAIADLPIDAVAKAGGGNVVVLVRSSVSAVRRRQLLEELLTVSELEEYDATPQPD
jgi:hypothetical protein